ncbi:putative Rhodanese-like domain-containing protein [Helianthus anomalus]
MAGLSCCCSLSSRSNLGTVSLRFNDGRRARVLSKSLRINAEISYVNGEEAKRLVAEEGYTIVDVRDRIQYERAHIKSCRHVPLFVENKDNDPGMKLLKDKLFMHRVTCHVTRAVWVMRR